MPQFIRLLNTPADDLMLSMVKSLAFEAAPDTLTVPEVCTSHGLVRVDELNLNVYPGLCEYIAHPEIQLTLGDLHGNALKLIHFLVFHGVMNITPEQYAKLVEIYRISAAMLTAENLSEFLEILEAATFNKVAMLRFIGDVFCDRGSNDYLTLRILKRLDEAKVRFEIIMSNHDLGLHYWLLNGEVLVWPATSLDGLITLWNRNLISLGEVKNLFTNHYKPYLKLISYSLGRDGKRASLYTHTRIGLDSIIKIATKMGMELKMDTIDNFFASLDTMNEIFQRCLKNGAVYRLFSRTTDPSDPFYMLFWNKELKSVLRLSPIAGVELQGVHGHEPDEMALSALSTSGFISLDCWLGREGFSHSFADYCQGYTFTPEQISYYRALHQHLILYSTDFYSHQLQEARGLREEAAEYKRAKAVSSKVMHLLKFFGIPRASDSTIEITPAAVLEDVPDEWVALESTMVFFKPSSCLVDDGRDLVAVTFET